MASNENPPRKTTNERLIIVETKLDLNADKMDAALDHQTKFAEDTKTQLLNVDKRLAKMDLNGRADKLRALADGAPEILEQKEAMKEILPVLKDILPTLKVLASDDMEKKIAKKWIGKKFSWTESRIVRGTSVAISGALSYVIIVQMGVGEAIVHWLGRVFGL